MKTVIDVTYSKTAFSLHFKPFHISYEFPVVSIETSDKEKTEETNTGALISCIEKHKQANDENNKINWSVCDDDYFSVSCWTSLVKH